MATQITDERVLTPPAVPVLDPPDGPAQEPQTTERETDHPAGCRCAVCAAYRIGTVLGKALVEAGIPLDLTKQEQQEVETLAGELREAQRIYNAVARNKAYSEMLEALAGDDGKDPTRVRDLEHLWHDHARMAEALHPFARRVIRPKIVAAALRIVAAEPRKILDMAAELNRLEPEIRAALDRLWGAKGKAAAGILGELSGLEGLSIDVDFGSEIENGLWQDRDAIAQACQQFADDPDMQVLAQAYALARQIREADEDNRDGVSSDGVEPEQEARSTLEEDQAGPSPKGDGIKAGVAVSESLSPGEPAEPEAGENEETERRFSPEKASVTFRRFADWLAARSLPEKLMAVVAWNLFMSNTREALKDEGLYGGDILDDLRHDWNQDVENAVEEFDEDQQFALELTGFLDSICENL